MSEKRIASGSAGNKGAKRARKSITLETKSEVVKRYERGESTACIKNAMGLSESTCRTIRDNSEKIKESIKAGKPLTASKSSYSRSPVIERMEKMLSTWIQDQNKKKANVSMDQIQRKALSLFENLKAQEKGEVKPFQASPGWFANFKIRHGFHNKIVSGESASADHAAAEAYPTTFKSIVEEGGYEARQIFNFDETGLYWKKMPNRTYISVEEKTAPGFKAAKDRITLMFGINMAGHKLKPVAVYHALNPRALKGMDHHYLPVRWYANAKGWMTSAIMQDYVNGKLRNELEKYCISEGIPFRILIVLDNASSHPPHLADLCPNIKVVFFPPNTTSLLQPLDQHVIKSFKSKYLKKCFDDLHNKTENTDVGVRDYWRAFNIKHALNFIKESWEEVSVQSIRSSWKNACPHMAQTFPGFDPVETEKLTRRSCLLIAQRLQLGDVDEEDIKELLEGHDDGELSNEDLLELEQHRLQEEAARENESRPPTPQRDLTVKLLKDFLAEINGSIQKIVENDPNMDRSNNMQRRVMSAVACYEELLRDKRQRIVQPTLHSFFSRSKSQPSHSRSITPDSTMSGPSQSDDSEELRLLEEDNLDDPSSPHAA